MTEVTRQIQLANRIKFGSRFLWSIEHERVHKFHLNQFCCWQAQKSSILHDHWNKCTLPSPPLPSLISTAGKIEHDARWKQKQSWKLFIHISNKSASIKTKDVQIKSSKLHCFNLILFYSKSCKLRTFPAVISRVFIFVMNGPSQKSTGCKVVSFVINVAYFEHILQLSNCKYSLFPLVEEEIRWSKYLTRTKPWNSRQDGNTAVSWENYQHGFKHCSLLKILLIPRPYTHNFICGATATHNWCPQLVLLHYFAIKVMFKAFYWNHFFISLYGKSQTVLIISLGECSISIIWCRYLNITWIIDYFVPGKFFRGFCRHD